MKEKTAIEKMVEWLGAREKDWRNPKGTYQEGFYDAITTTDEEARRLALEEKSHKAEVKPTANADLVGELTQVLEDWEINGNPMQKLELEAILSKYRPVPVVKEQGEAGLRNKAYGECKNVGKTCRACYAEYCTTRVYEVPPLPTPAPVASGLVDRTEELVGRLRKFRRAWGPHEGRYVGHCWEAFDEMFADYDKGAK